MAVRFTAGTDRLHRTVSLGSKTAYTITGWFQITVDRNAFSTFWSVNNTADAGSGAHILQAIGDGTSIVVWSTNQSAVVTATVGTWYFIGISANGANWTGRVRALGAGSFTNVSGTNLNNPSTFNQIRFGDSHYTNEQLDGRIEALKIWNVALTGAEMEAEYSYRKPVKTSDVLAYYKWTVSETTDDSGNGWTLTETGTVDIEAGPAGLVDEPTTPKSVSDTGSSAESLSATTTLPLNDTASSSEVVSVARAAALSDTASSIQSLIAAASVTVAETGSAAEQLTIARFVNLNDSGLAADSLSLNATAALTDTGLSGESLSVNAVSVIGDTGNASDAITTGSPVALSDAGTATESLAVTPAVSLIDTASAVDALEVSRALVLTDAGTGADALAATPLVSLSDTATAVDSATASALVPLADMASSSESVTQGTTKSLADTGQASEALTVSVALSAFEVASAFEGLVKDYAELHLTDTGSAFDALNSAQGESPGAMAYAEALTHAMASRISETSEAVYAPATAPRIERIIEVIHRMEGGK